MPFIWLRVGMNDMFDEVGIHSFSRVQLFYTTKFFIFWIVPIWHREVGFTPIGRNGWSVVDCGF